MSMHALFKDKRPAPRHVAIIGAGFSGTLTAIHLLEGSDCQVTLVEQSDRVAAGAAYSTDDGSHLLNVRASNMSAYPDAPHHFADWLMHRHGQSADTFAERRVYREYLAEQLAPHGSDPRLRIVRGRASAIERGTDGLRVLLEDGAPLACDQIVLALGNLPAGGLPLPTPIEDDRVITHPWSPEGREALRRLAGQPNDILLLGTGLTMVDMCLSLRSLGFQGRILATSRRGLVPHVHEAFAPSPLSAPPPARLAALLRDTRRRAETHGWRAAVDALRPHSVDLWLGFSSAEKVRFLRHLRAWWDVHRHRIAPGVHAMLDALQREGRFEVAAGRISAVKADGPTLDVRIARRGGRGELRRNFAAIVNCTGPARIGDTPNPLVRSLLDSGLARADALGLGLDVDLASRVISGTGEVTGDLFAIGPLSRGRFWEIIAVPDIRRQVREVADTIASPPVPSERLMVFLPQA